MAALAAPAPSLGTAERSITRIDSFPAMNWPAMAPNGSDFPSHGFIMNCNRESLQSEPSFSISLAYSPCCFLSLLSGLCELMAPTSPVVIVFPSPSWPNISTPISSPSSYGTGESAVIPSSGKPSFAAPSCRASIRALRRTFVCEVAACSVRPMTSATVSSRLSSQYGSERD